MISLTVSNDHELIYRNFLRGDHSRVNQLLEDQYHCGISSARVINKNGKPHFGYGKITKDIIRPSFVPVDE